MYEGVQRSVWDSMKIWFAHVQKAGKSTAGDRGRVPVERGHNTTSTRAGGVGSKSFLRNISTSRLEMLLDVSF